MQSARYVPKKMMSTDESKNSSRFQPVEFSLEELRQATDVFHPRNELGRGGFGVVYRGRLANGSQVAIKKLHYAKDSFISETSMPVHPNLLPLLGFCKADWENLLVFPYMTNGSLASCLIGHSQSKSLLSWDRRKRIAHGSATALAHLHNSKIIHRDIKADNILLNENFEAFVADFDLVRLMDPERTHATTDLRGTPGYMAPEYVQESICSEKTDVYGYGILLLEIITGKRFGKIMLNKNVKPLDGIIEVAQSGNFRSLVDSDLDGNYILKEAEQLFDVALQCTKLDPKERPKMFKVVQMLEPLARVASGSQSRKPSNSLPHKFSFKELIEATNNFSRYNLLGHSRCGVTYTGRLTDGSVVMIKHLHGGMVGADALLAKEKSIPKHQNLLPLIGFCSTPMEKLLVSPFMINGSLAARLGESQLDWERRKVIAHGTAVALAYLHDFHIVHRGIKPESILLNKDFEAVVAGFDEVAFFHHPAVSYVPARQDFERFKMWERNDIFKYGTLLLAIVGANRYRENLQTIEFSPKVAARLNHEGEYLGILDIMDSNLQGKYDYGEAKKLISVAMRCIKDTSKKGLKMSEVVKMLEDLAQTSHRGANRG